MEGIYYIENTVDEWHSSIQGYFTSKEEAIEALKNCCDWFRPNGTGKIYFKKFGLKQLPQLIYENY